MNKASEQRLSKVHPELAKRVRTMVSQLAEYRGIKIEVVQGLRTFAEQDALFAQGRSKPGKVVTKARSGLSNHNYGLAVDVVPVENGKINWEARESVWKIIGQECVRAGLAWGGNWKSFPDRPHCELPTGYQVRECLAMYKNGGIELVWKRASQTLQLLPNLTAQQAKTQSEPTDEKHTGEVPSSAAEVAVLPVSPSPDAEKSSGTPETVEGGGPTQEAKIDFDKVTEKLQHQSVVSVAARLGRRSLYVDAVTKAAETYSGLSLGWKVFLWVTVVSLIVFGVVEVHAHWPRIRTWGVRVKGYAKQAKDYAVSKVL